MTRVIQPTWTERIVLGQQSDPYLQKVRAEIEQGKDGDSSIRTDGSLRFRGRWCVPSKSELRNDILFEAHRSPYTVHPGRTKNVSRFEAVFLVAWDEARRGLVIDWHSYTSTKWFDFMVCRCRSYQNGTLASYPSFEELIAGHGGIRLNNSYQASIGIASYEALYGRRCRSPICYDDVGERRLIGPDLVENAEAKIRIARERLLTAQSRQRSYANKRS
uniref:Integrase zinc-binding domain-containing protein n=1 Tax=Ananas comosus var. bracteatus TaxID=296719 RepID=A0A6V7PRA4_ANACO|nr:unnamed protein product [Ananas comosus var. bracteatus]